MMADSCVARKMRIAALVVEDPLNIDSVAGQLGFVVLQDLTLLTLLLTLDAAQVDIACTSAQL